jgi:2,4-dienoyl-CoA reductase-like NADH-dependent reductase (Old Yellow Enzyme family)/thioredoxin reductase
MKLFTPINIGKLEVKNRIVMPAMATGFASEDGQVTERMISYYEERAKGGVGLIILEYTGVERRGRPLPMQNMIDMDRFIPGLQKLVEVIKKHGAKAAIQLQHGGIKASAKITQIQPVGPSDFPDYPLGMGPPPRALTIKEIHNLVLAFGEAARRAKEAGFDAIELHCTHSYLIDQFMSPRFNQRTDTYGGSIENRARFACEIIECMKEKVGKDYPIICRMTGDEFVRGGITLKDAKVTAKLLVESGADCLHVSVGISDNMIPTLPMSFPQGFFLHLAEGIKKEVNVPVIGVGKISNPEFAERALTEGKCDLVAMGRALIADPYLPKKAKEGKEEDIIPCIYCNQGCISRISDWLDITCLVNPTVGREMEFQIVGTKIPKKVLIVGAGPAGLETAIIAKQRGHDVILAEKEVRLGGQLNYALRPPKKDRIEKLVEYFSEQVKKLRIKTYLGKFVTKNFVQEINPNIIIMATGSTPRVPEISGVDGENVSLAIEVLGGKKVLGKRVVVIGGGQVGLETADFLAETGKEVMVLEMLSEVGIDVPPRNKMFLMKKLSEENVQIFVNRKVQEIYNKGVRADHFGQEEEFTCDAIIIAVGSKPQRTLMQELKEIIPELEGFYIIGDCVEPRKALEAIYEGACIARTI